MQLLKTRSFNCQFDYTDYNTNGSLIVSVASQIKHRDDARIVLIASRKPWHKSFKI